MGIPPTLATKADKAARILADTPPEVIKEVGKAIRPITYGFGRLLQSVAGVVDKAGDHYFGEGQRQVALVVSHQQHQREMAALQHRLKNQELILKAELAQQLKEFSIRELKSCISFINAEVARSAKVHREQLEFFRSWKNDLRRQEKQLRASAASGEIDKSDPVYDALREDLLEELKVVREMITFEAQLFVQLQRTLVGTISQAHQLPRLTVKALKERRDVLLLTG